MTDKARKSDSGGRVLRVMKALRGHSLNGLSNSELSKKLGETPATINRCLNTLIAEGLALKHESGRFSLSVAMLQIAQAHAEEINRAQHRIAELNQRVAAGSY